jgi:hypothetical protein
MSRLAAENKTLFQPPEISVPDSSQDTLTTDEISLTEKGNYAKKFMFSKK